MQCGERRGSRRPRLDATLTLKDGNGDIQVSAARRFATYRGLKTTSLQTRRRLQKLQLALTPCREIAFQVSVPRLRSWSKRPKQ